MACGSTSGKILLGKCCAGYTRPPGAGWWFKSVRVIVSLNGFVPAPQFDGLEYANEIADQFDYESVLWETETTIQEDLNSGDRTQSTHQDVFPLVPTVYYQSNQRRIQDLQGIETGWDIRHMFLGSVNLSESCDKNYSTVKGSIPGLPGATTLEGCDLVNLPFTSKARMYYLSTEPTLFSTSIRHELFDPCCPSTAP